MWNAHSSSEMAVRVLILEGESKKTTDTLYVINRSDSHVRLNEWETNKMYVHVLMVRVYTKVAEGF